MIRKLGKQPYRHDSRTLRLAHYLDQASLPAAPPKVDWTSGITDWDMMLNDQLGDCTVAGLGHLIQMMTAAHNGWEITIPDTAILSAYEIVGGYKPGDPSTDNGAVMLDVLKYARAVGIGGHKIRAFGQVDHTNLAHVRLAAWLFGGLYTGVQLPLLAQPQVGFLWAVPTGTGGDGAPGSWGGHCMALPLAQQPASGHATAFEFVTWGRLQAATTYWWDTYVDECWFCVADDWERPTGLSPSGLRIDQLLADAKAIA